MTEYRAFVVGSDGNFISFTSMVCDDDAAAIELASKRLYTRDIELWTGTRMVIRLHHKLE